VEERRGGAGTPAVYTLELTTDLARDVVVKVLKEPFLA
jgi:hypothetical protein